MRYLITYRRERKARKGNQKVVDYGYAMADNVTDWLLTIDSPLDRYFIVNVFEVPPEDRYDLEDQLLGNWRERDRNGQHL